MNKAPLWDTRERERASAHLGHVSGGSGVEEVICYVFKPGSGASVSSFIVEVLYGAQQLGATQIRSKGKFHPENRDSHLKEMTRKFLSQIKRKFYHPQKCSIHAICSPSTFVKWNKYASFFITNKHLEKLQKQAVFYIKN